MNAFLQSALTFFEQNTALLLSWIVIFQGILVLCVLWLAHRVRSAPNAMTLEKAEEARQQVHAVNVKMDKLDTYVREQFTKDFSGAMKSFDDTTTAVLGQMKDELIQGVQRIEQIETAVSKKNILEQRVEQSHKDVQNLINAPDEKLIDETSSDTAKKNPSDAEANKPVSVA